MRQYAIIPDDAGPKSQIVPPNRFIQKIIFITKQNGKLRQIYVPTKEHKNFLREILDSESSIVNHKFSQYVMGFVKGRNIITNAKQHVGYKYTLNFDIENFFDSVKVDVHLKNKIPEAVLKACLYDNYARQGLPTSPFLANVAAESLDDSIARICRKYPDDKIIYTRYADDLCLSFNESRTIQFLMDRIPITCSNARFPINPAKTRLQAASNGRRMITGIAVDSEIHVPRRIKRKIRAAQFQLEQMMRGKAPADSNIIRQVSNSLKGLNEFEKLRDPVTLRQDPMWMQKKRQQTILKDLITFYNEFGLPEKLAKQFTLPTPKIIPEVTESAEDGLQFIITNDPIYFAGMSTFTSGWTSCMSMLSRNSNQYRQGAWFWNNHPGVSIAALIGEPISIGKITRPRLYARTLLYKTTAGKIYYGRRYPDGQSIVAVLREILQSRGIVWSNHGEGEIVEGEVKINWDAVESHRVRLPYFDNVNVKRYFNKPAQIVLKQQR